MRDTEKKRQRIMLWTNGRNLALELDWLNSLYDGFNSSPRVVLYEAAINPEVWSRERTVLNRLDVEKAQKAIRLGLSATVPEPVLEDTSGYPQYECVDAYRIALAHYLEKHVKYSEFDMEFQVNFQGQEGDGEEDVEEIPSFPLKVLLPGGQVAYVVAWNCIRVEDAEWPAMAPTFSPERDRSEQRKAFMERIAAAQLPSEVVAMCEAFAQGIDAYRKGTTDRMEREGDDSERRQLAEELGLPLPPE